jgi:hypothetical protein
LSYKNSSLEIHTILYRPVYNIFQTLRRSKQDPKSFQLCRSPRYSFVYNRECIPAFIGECPTPRQHRMYRMWYLSSLHIIIIIIIISKPFQEITYLLTYMLLIYSMEQLVSKFPAFYGTKININAFTCTRSLSRSSARFIQSMPSSTLSEATS